MAACVGMLAVLGTFISFFIGSFDPWSCFPVVLFLLYLSGSDALHSLIQSVVISSLVCPPSAPLIRRLYSSLKKNALPMLVWNA